MLLNFKYIVKEDLAKLAKVEIVGWPINNDVNGWVDEADINAGNLAHCSLWLCCEYMDDGKTTVQMNPLAIVARNQTTAIQIYNKVTGKEGTIKCAIFDKCNKLTVVPTGVTTI